ncbi:sporulation protein YqfD [Solibacillus sp. R5-41]|uniref:sporulation protein YqfD n=1 Tax=Solibacillus sp. R5-41 TaxID=2048654 RepID=UPI0020A33386|nr:sporulation protein YqfD [Solibacillus sp. R5-41]
MNQRLLYISLKQGNAASSFIQYLKNHQVPLYNIRFKQQEITFYVAHFHLPIIRNARRNYYVKLKIRYATPNRILQKDIVSIFGLLILLVIPIILSQFVWKIDVQANTVELEDEVYQYLTDGLAIQLPVRRGQFTEDYLLRQQLMEQFREFSWIHITKQGSHIIVAPQLAPKLSVPKKATKKQHLIASNSGVITHFKISSGVRKVDPNETVYKGDTLVSGVLERDGKHFVVDAQGEVFADYWLESTFSIPRQVTLNVLSDYGWEYKWNWEQLQKALQQQSIKPLKTIISYTPYQKFEQKTELIDEDEINTFVLPLLHEKMIRSLPLESTIKNEKLLHVTTDDDTVKGKVLFLVNENIAKPRPIDQGE